MNCSAALLLLLLLASGCGVPHEHGLAPAEVWAAHCMRCHDQNGASTTANEMAGGGIDLRNQEFHARTTDTRIRQIALRGRGLMQGVDLPPAELDSILVYLRALRAE